MPQDIPASQGQGATQEPQQQNAEDLISRAFSALSELSTQASQSPGVSDSAKQNLKMSLKGLESFVQLMSAQGEQAPAGGDIVGEHTGSKEVIPAG